MKCISPINIKHPNGSKRYNVPCGKCLFCLQTKRNDWTFRLHQELRTANTAKFLTLTYTDEQIPWANQKQTLVKTDLQLFFKRLREHQERKTDNKWKIRYYATGEYGTETQRPHYHAIAFNIHEKLLDEIEKIWGLGIIQSGDVTPASIRYVTKYLINKNGSYTDQQKPFALMSKKLGAKYIDRTIKYHRENNKLTVINDVGKEQALPRYYKEKMFSRKELDLINSTLIIQADKIEAKAKLNFIRKNPGSNYFNLEQQAIQTKLEQAELKLNKKNKL